MRIGILGAGQLGRMLALSGMPLGFSFRFLDPEGGESIAGLAPVDAADYGDAAALEAFARRVDCVTFEFENVPADAVRALAAARPVQPSARALDVAQDRLVEKRFFRELEIGTPEFAEVGSRMELAAALRRVGLPSILKTRRHGYDGKGQCVLRVPRDEETAWGRLGGGSLILEQLIPFDRELSILAVRDRKGQCAFWTPVQTHHGHGILRVSLAPAPRLTAELTAAAQALARRILEALDYVGVLALELFETRGRLIANEMAPRVHNSGHWTLEGAETSQFENHLRAVAGLPLGHTRTIAPCAMLNLIGSLPDLSKLMELPGAHVHLYGKEPRPGRKLGHVTLRGQGPEELRATLEAAWRIVRPGGLGSAPPPFQAPPIA